MKTLCVGYRNEKGAITFAPGHVRLMKDGPETDRESSSGICRACSIEQVKVYQKQMGIFHRQTMAKIKKKPSKHVCRPYLWLKPKEKLATAEIGHCRCRLLRNFESTGDAAFLMCAYHQNTAKITDAARGVFLDFEKFGIVNMDTVQRLKDAIIEAQGGI